MGHVLSVEKGARDTTMVPTPDRGLARGDLIAPRLAAPRHAARRRHSGGRLVAPASPTSQQLRARCLVPSSPPVLPGRSPPAGSNIGARGQRPRAHDMRAPSRPTGCSGCRHARAGVAPQGGPHAGTDVVERGHPVDLLTHGDGDRRATWERSKVSGVSGTRAAAGSLCTSRSSSLVCSGPPQMGASAKTSTARAR
jgi:hypothetical protein